MIVFILTTAYISHCLTQCLGLLVSTFCLCDDKISLSVLWQVNSLGETAERLIQSHPEAVDDIQEKCTELNTAWSSLVGRADQRKDKLGNSHDLQRFLSDFR